MEQKSVVVEVSLPSRSPARVSQAESPTSQTNEQTSIVVESCLPSRSPARVSQAKSPTSETNEQTSIVVESSLPSGSPTRVSQAKSPTSQTNEQTSIVVESSLPSRSPARVSQAKLPTSQTNEQTSIVEVESPTFQTNEQTSIVVESSLPCGIQAQVSQAESPTSQTNEQTSIVVESSLPSGSPARVSQTKLPTSQANEQTSIVVESSLPSGSPARVSQAKLPTSQTNEQTSIVEVESPTSQTNEQTSIVVESSLPCGIPAQVSQAESPTSQTNEQTSIVVESSLPSGSPAQVSQAESPTSQTNEQTNIVVESSLPSGSPARVSQAKLPTSQTNEQTSIVEVESPTSQTNEQTSIVVESSLPCGNPAQVSQAEPPTSQTNAALYDNGNMATEEVAEIRIDVVESSTLPISPAHVPQVESSTSSRNPPFDNGNMATEQEEDISIIVESSTLPSPAHVPQAESSTSNRNLPFEVPAKPTATEDITQESSLTNLVHFTQCESSTSRANLGTGMPTEPAATEEITEETSPPNGYMLSEPAITEEMTGENNLQNQFVFAQADLSNSDTDDLDDSMPLGRGKSNMRTPEGGAAEEITNETSVPNPTDETSVPNPIHWSSPPKLAKDRYSATKDTRSLCLAAVKGEWETAKSIIENNQNLVRVWLTRERDTLLHIAVTGKCLDFVRELVASPLMQPDDMLTANINNDTALHIAAVSGMLEIAKLIVKKNPMLLLSRGTDDLTPLAMAIRGGHREMVDYLYGEAELHNRADEEYICLVLDSLSSKLYGTALKLVEGRETMAYERDRKTGKTALHVLAQAPPEVSTVSYGLKSIVENFYKYVRKPTVAFRSIVFPSLDFTAIAWKLLTRRTTVSDLLKNNREMTYESTDWEQVLSKILDQVMEIASEDITDLIRTPSNVIFDATMSGNVQFLAVLLRRYPELLWEKDERGRSIFHVAVVYRQENVFNLIYNTGAVKDYLVGIEDSDGNSMLHLAGMSSENKEKIGGLRANLLMQQEILWFKEVEKIVRPDQRNKKNSGGKTPREVFIEEHRGLLRGGEHTIKGTAKSCMLVATLIATVVFAAPLNVQGMNSPSKKLQSWIFALSNAAALCSSTSSIVMSLSILTSSYAQSDFVDSLHRRLIIALTTLFVSIATMVAAFGAAIFVIFDHVPLLTLTATIPFAGLPVMLFLMFHGDLFADLSRSYRWSKSLFKPSVHKIFV